VAITREMGRESALTMGIEKAYAMVRHVGETAEADTVEGLLAADAPIGKTSATSAKAVDVEAATRALRERNTKSRATPRTAAAKEKDALVKKVRAHLAKLGLTRPEVSVGTDRVTIKLTRKAVERLPDR
jgi:hypothetical protein